MRIEDLRPAKGAKKRRKIVGRGPGSGHGKTSTRGHKGQMSRTGKGTTPGFEGGQMPLIRKMPKRGFSKRINKGHTIVNLDNLAALKKETSITPELLKEKGLIKNSADFVKVLGDGEIKIPINIKAHAFSKTALEKIKNVGGKCEIIT
ncbi:MAG: 50S ribosomal protein L15 [Candidatus Omnitrophica bacterium]|nr:50S ribosomal protein L15 [Candidatus Omnitrophota bacterium]MBU4589387.1 50S ribosomal protein L15 [Candidatus Omnitrophota bacterium]